MHHTAGHHCNIPKKTITLFHTPQYGLNMKHTLHFFLFIFILLVLSSCGTTTKGIYNNHVILSQRDITDPAEQMSFITNHHPELNKYYKEGLLNIRRLREMHLDNGETAWDFKYGFREKEIKDYGERMDVLKYSFPEIYRLFCDGKVILEEVKEYVDEDTGSIKYQIEYKRLPY